MRREPLDRLTGEEILPQGNPRKHYEPYDDDRHTAGASTNEEAMNGAEWNQAMLDRAVKFLIANGRLRWCPEVDAFILVSE